MAIFHPPIPPVFTGGAQPYGEKELTPQLLAPANNPPFTLGGPIAIIAALIAIAQPDPWQYVFEGQGGNQPYAPGRLTAATLAIRQDNPPFTYGGPIAGGAEVVALAQPDPWQYNSELGPATGTQPYAPRLLNPSITAVPVNNPPFVYGGPVAPFAVIVGMAQPDPWTFNFDGNLAPFMPRTLSPGIPGQSVDQPPFAQQERLGGLSETALAEAKTLWQPDPWVYNYLGAAQGRQPYGPPQLNPSITAVPVNNPPFDRKRAETNSELIALTQPDPWTYSFFGATQPFAPKQNSPAIPGQSVAPPPFDQRSAQAAAELIGLAQPDPWCYPFLGGYQPYGPRPLAPFRADIPPFDERTASQRAELVALTQPEVWTYSFEGAAQPYAPRTLSPGIPGQSVNEPPYDRRQAETTIEIVALNQPPIWPYTFVGGWQPYAQLPLSPFVEAVPLPIPGAGKRYKPPTDYLPPPPYETKPAKPFQPVWDRLRQEEEAARRRAAEEAARPLPAALPPLPPPSIFGAAPSGAPTLAPQGLPTFDHLVPPDLPGLAQRMQEAQDLSDAIAVLKALGLNLGG